MICRWHAGIDKSLYKPAGKEYHTFIKLFIKADKGFHMAGKAEKKNNTRSRIISREQHMVVKSHALQIENYSLSFLEQSFSCPVYFENDANAAMMAEDIFLILCCPLGKKWWNITALTVIPDIWKIVRTEKRRLLWEQRSIFLTGSCKSPVRLRTATGRGKLLNLTCKFVTE